MFQESIKNIVCLVAISALLLATGCNREAKKEHDEAAVSRGSKLFTQQCASCHSIDKDAIGPALGGVTLTTTNEWLKRFVKNPGAVIAAGDEHAARLFVKYKVTMPSFDHLSEEQINDVITFLSVQKPAEGREEVDSLALKDPIPQGIRSSDVVVNLKYVTTIPPSAQQGQLTRICKLDFRPDTKQNYVLDLRGKLYSLRGETPEVYLDLTKQFPQFIDHPGLASGFGSFAFHPEFRKNGLLYTTHTEHTGSGEADFKYNDSIKVTLQWVLTEWKTESPDKFPFEGKSREMLRVNMLSWSHGLQEITFNPLAKKGDEDYGLLYVGIGDGASAEYGFPELAHSTEKIWGTILRLDPIGRNSKNEKYGIPASNPFVQHAGEHTVHEIFAYGFRNPHRISWTSTGDMIVSNIGHHNIESLYKVVKGSDQGWPIREGSFLMDIKKGMQNVYPVPENDTLKINYPIAEYDHDEGNAISGGYEYTGSTINRLKGKYLFGDIVNGRLFFIELSSIAKGEKAEIQEWKIALNGKITTLKTLCGADKVDVRFGRDASGEIYILTKPDGKIYKLIP